MVSALNFCLKYQLQKYYIQRQDINVCLKKMFQYADDTFLILFTSAAHILIFNALISTSI